MSYCIEDLPEHQYNACLYRKGGITGFAPLFPNHGITDFSDKTQWEAAIANAKTRIVKKIKAEMPEPAAVEGENVVACGSDTIVDGYDYIIEIQDYNVNDSNDAFYAKLNTIVRTGGLAVYFCEEDEIRVTERNVTFNARLVVPMNNKEKQHYLITAKWSQSVQEAFPALYDAPEEIFDFE
jgi:hypothetical protein